MPRVGTMDCWWEGKRLARATCNLLLAFPSTLLVGSQQGELEMADHMTVGCCNCCNCDLVAKHLL